MRFIDFFSLPDLTQQVEKPTTKRKPRKKAGFIPNIQVNIRDDFSNKSKITTYDVVESTSINNLIQIIKANRNLNFNFEILSGSGSSLQGFRTIKDVIEEFGRIPLRVEKLVEIAQIEEIEDDEEFHLSKLG